MPNIGITEIIVILVVAVLFFGAGSIPRIGKAIGEGLREFRRASRGDPPREEQEVSETQSENECKKPEASDK